MASATILVVSPDKDFSHSLAEQVQGELALACRIAENREAAKAHTASAALVVASEDDAGAYSCPVLVVNRPPLRMRELLADIEALLQKPAEALPLGGGYRLTPRMRQLSYGGKTVGLTDKEAQLLQCLAEAGNKGAARDKLLKDVWGIDAILDTHTLETHIYRLRGKLRELSGDDSRITASDGGYKWTGK